MYLCNSNEVRRYPVNDDGTLKTAAAETLITDLRTVDSIQTVQWISDQMVSYVSASVHFEMIVKKAIKKLL